MNFIDWLESHRRSLLFIAFAVTLAGVMAGISLPIQLFPTVSFPRIRVEISSGEMPANTMLIKVTEPLEKVARAVPGAVNVESTTTRGSAEIFVDFPWGYNMTNALLRVETALAQKLPDLPPDTGYDALQMAPNAIMPFISFAMISNTVSPAELQTIAKYQIAPLLTGIPGIREVRTLGGQTSEVQIYVSPEQLQTYGLTPVDVANAVSGSNSLQAVGRLQDNDPLAAAKVIEKEQPDSPLGYNLEGAANLGKKDIAAARANFEKAISVQPTNFTAVLNLVQLDLVEKKPDAAKKRLEAFLDKDKKNIQAMTALAGLAQSQGQTKEATDLLERAHNENPDMLQPAILLAAHYLQIGEKQKALTFAQKLQGSNPDNPDVLDILAKAQFANGDKPAALQTYNKIAAIRPDSALAQFRIASIQMAMQNQSAASDALKKALTLQPDYPDAQVALASLEAGKGNLEQSLAIARQIQKQHRKSPLGYALEGDVLMAQKKPALAVKAYEQAFAIDKSGPLMIKLHASLSQAGKSKEASSRLNEWLKEHPADSSTHMYLAGTYLAEKQNKAAIEQYQTVLQHDPKYVPALNNLAWLYQQEKDPRALEYAEKANQIAPDSPASLDTLGWILVEQGNTTRGLPLLQKANTLSPESADIHYHLVLGLVKSGDKTKARKELEQLLATGKTFAEIEEARELLKQL